MYTHANMSTDMYTHNNKVNLMQHSTASVTANTDFSQTEIDDAQVNLTRFALFFPEKREFFLRDNGIFTFADLNEENGIPFFSRRIGLDEHDESTA